MFDTGLVRDYSLTAMMWLTARNIVSFLPQILAFRNSKKMGAVLAALAIDGSHDGITSAYFDGAKRIASSAMSNDETLALELWEASRKLTGLTMEESSL